jgi:hypothetical protein
MYKQITKGVAITITSSRIYLHLVHHKPVIISAEDKYRKGIEIAICSRCQTPQVCQIWTGRRHYCENCWTQIYSKKKLQRKVESVLKGLMPIATAQSLEPQT